MSTTSKPISAARSQIDGYEAAAARLATITAWPLPTVETFDATGYVLTAAGRGDKAAPADLAERITRQRLAEQGASDALAVVRSARDRADGELDAIVRADPDPALAWLADRLAEVVTAARAAFEDLPAGVSAQSAARRGGTTLRAWQTVTEAADDYDRVRAEQWAILSHAPRPETATDRHSHRTWFLRSGLLADALDHEQTWVDARATAAGARLVVDSEAGQTWQTTITRDGEREARILGTPTDPDPTAAGWLTGFDLRTPDGLARADAARTAWLLACRPTGWPSTVTTSSWWPSGDRIGYLRWLVTTARPWVPTHAQLIEADATATAALASTDGLQRGHSLADRLTAANDALTTHRTITGARSHDTHAAA